MQIKSVGEIDDSNCSDLNIETSSVPIKSGDHLLLILKDGKPFVGVEDWSMEATRECLLEDQVSALYGFMLVERAGLVSVDSEDDSEDDSEGNGQAQLTSESSNTTSSEGESP